MKNVHSAIEAIARSSYGRLLSYLAYRFQNLAVAEDALAVAIERAIKTWPANGLPESPEAWLMTTAKRELLQTYRHEQVVNYVVHDPALEVYNREEFSAPESDEIPDRRLKLLFVCAHPAIDSGLHTALMLQTVLGLDVARIAQAYAVPTSTLAQRLVRAKQKIKLAGIRFEEPDEADFSGRLASVLEAVYAAYSLENNAGEDLSSEAIYLASMLAHLLPKQAEVLGLWSLLLSSSARKPAQYALTGEFIPLHQQDTALWDKTQIEEANALLYRAFAMLKPGPFQLEAAIQSAHCQRLYTGQVPWAGIVSLYAQLIQIAPTLGASTAYAAALIEADQLDLSKRILAQLAEDKRMEKGMSYFQSYAPYWLTQARLAKASNDFLNELRHLVQALEIVKKTPETKHQKAQVLYLESQIVLCKTQD